MQHNLIVDFIIIIRITIGNKHFKKTKFYKKKQLAFSISIIERNLKLKPGLPVSSLLIMEKII